MIMGEPIVKARPDVGQSATLGAIDALGQTPRKPRRLDACSKSRSTAFAFWFTPVASPGKRARKSDGHGLSVNRPQMTAYDPGTSPPRADAAPSGPVQKHDYETHRPVKSMPRRDVTDRGLLRL